MCDNITPHSHSLVYSWLFPCENRFCKISVFVSRNFLLFCTHCYSFYRPAYWDAIYSSLWAILYFFVFVIFFANYLHYIEKIRLKENMLLLFCFMIDINLKWGAGSEQIVYNRSWNWRVADHTWLRHRNGSDNGKMTEQQFLYLTRKVYGLSFWWVDCV